MAAKLDFISNVETAFLSLFAADDILSGYNWEKWDSDKELKLPRGYLGLRARRDPEETPYHRIDVTVTFEGRPKKTKLSVVMAALKSLLETKSPSDLTTASGNTVKFIGQAVSVNEDRRIAGGLRTWVFTFALYAVPMV
jgi:hypothetical protein